MLGERVREHLAAVLPDAGRIRVRARRGTAALRGTVTAEERDRVLNAVLAVPGVMNVTNNLEVQGPEAAAIERGAMKSGMAAPGRSAGPTKGSDPDLERDPGFFGAR